MAPRTLHNPPPRKRSWALLLGAAALVTGCASDQLVLPSDGGPAAIQVVQGDGQAAPVGSMLRDSLVVELSDGMDRPVQGGLVAFLPVGSDAGTTAPDTAVTDALGRAASRWKLGSQAGAQEVEARVVTGGESGLVASFKATAQPGAATTLQKVRGDSQFGQTATRLPDSLVVRATDDFGNPVAGVQVSWQPSGGSISPAQGVTGTDGKAAASWTLGLIPGTQVAAASASGLSGSPITFHAAAQVGPQPTLAVATQPAPTASSGQPLSTQPVVQLKLPSGGSLLQSGVPVTAAIASGSGLLGGNSVATTDKQGQARFTNLSITGLSGNYSLIFASAGFLAVISDPIALTGGLPSGRRSSLQVTPSSIAAGNGTATVTAVVRDDSNTPITGASVLLTASGSGNSLVQPGVTDPQGKATGTFSSTVAGSHTISAKADGVDINQTVTVTVQPGSAEGGHSTAVVPDGQQGSATVITITTRDQYGNQLTTGGATVVVRVTGANSTSPSVSDRHDGSYTASYTPQAAGTDLVEVQVNGTPVPGSPFTSTVAQSASGPDPAHTTASIPGNVKVLHQVKVVITTADATGKRLTSGGYAADLDVRVSGANSGHPQILDRGDGTYEASYLPLFKGTDTIAITFQGTPISGSPYQIQIK